MSSLISNLFLCSGYTTYWCICNQRCLRLEVVVPLQFVGSVFINLSYGIISTAGTLPPTHTHTPTWSSLQVYAPAATSISPSPKPESRGKGGGKARGCFVRLQPSSSTLTANFDYQILWKSKVSLPGVKTSTRILTNKLLHLGS